MMDETLANLTPRRKRMLYRASHRGMKENDLLLGSFARRWLPSMTAHEADLFEELLEIPDGDLYQWMVGQKAIPEPYDHAVMAKLLAHRDTPPEQR